MQHHIFAFRLLIKNLYSLFAYLVLLQSYDETCLQRIAHAYFVATGPCYVIGNLIGVVLLGGQLTSLVPRPHVWERDYRLTRKTDDYKGAGCRQRQTRVKGQSSSLPWDVFSSLREFSFVLYVYELFWLCARHYLLLPASAIVRLNSLTSRQHVPQYDSRIQTPLYTTHYKMRSLAPPIRMVHSL